MENSNSSQIIAWLKIIQSMNLDDFFNYIIQNLFHEDIAVRRFSIQSIKINRIKKAASHLYNLYRQSDSLEEKKLILSALADVGDKEIAKNLMKIFSTVTDANLRIEILNIISHFKELRGVEDLITELATQEGEDQVKFAAIFNLATTGNYLTLSRMIDRKSNERESFLSLMAISANIEENRNILKNLEKIPKKTTAQLDKRDETKRNILLIKKIVRNRIKNFPSYSKDIQFAYINTFIDSRERGLAIITRQIFNGDSIEDKLYLLDILDFKFEKIIEKEKILIQLCNIKSDTSSIRQKVIAIFQVVLDKNLLTAKEDSFIKSVIQKLFIKTTEEFYYYFDSSVGEKDRVKKMGNFMFLHGNEKIRNLINIYLDQNRVDKKMIKDIAHAFFESSDSFPLKELKNFIYGLNNEHVPFRKRIVIELNSIQFDKAHLRNKVMILLKIISLLKLNKISEKVFKLYRLSLEHKDSELTSSSIYTMVSLKFGAVFQEIMAHWIEYNFVSKEDILMSIGALPGEKTLELLLKFFNRKLVPQSVMPQAVDVLGEIAPQNHVIALSLLHNLYQLQTDKTSIVHAMGKIGTIQTMEFLIDIYIKKNNRDSQIIDAICSISRRNLKEKNDINDIIENLYRILKNTKGIARIQIIAILIIFEDDYVKKIFPDIIVQVSNYEIDTFFSFLYSLLESLEEKKIQNYLPYLKEFVRLTAIRPELAEGFSQLIQLMTKEEKKLLLPAILTESGIRAKKEVVAESEFKEISEKRKFIEERENQRELTLLFADITGYTKKSSELSILDIMDLVREYENISIPIIEKNKGNVIKKMGDGIMVSFTSALYAVNAALQIQKELTRLNQFRIGLRRIVVRIGVNSGLVYIRQGDVFGDTVNMASRMESNAKPGTILITRSTYEIIKEHIYCLKLPPIQVKGKDEPVVCFRPMRVVGSIEKIAALEDSKSQEKFNQKDSALPNGVVSKGLVSIDELKAFFNSKEPLFAEEGRLRLDQFFEYMNSLDSNIKEKKAIDDFVKGSIGKCLKILGNGKTKK